MLRAHALDLDFNGRALLADVNLHLPSGARIALIGDNGSGKSCLLQMLAGTLVPSGGTIIRRDGARIAYVPQQCSMTPLAAAASRCAMRSPARLMPTPTYCYWMNPAITWTAVHAAR